MQRLFLLTVFAWTSGAATLAAAEDDAKVHYIDLKAAANQKIDESVSSRADQFPDNDLRNLPTGEQELAEAKFHIGPKAVLLGSKQVKDRPESVEINVGRKFDTLYLLQGTQFGAFGDEGHPFFVKDGTRIGEYAVQYADGKSETIPIVYGEHVRDWWDWDKRNEVETAKVAWTGTNPDASRYSNKLRLYAVEWENPRPDVEVKEIEFQSNMETAAAPFLVAATAVRK